MKNVSIRGPIKDFKTNLSSFFTALHFSICKATGFLAEIIFNACSFLHGQKMSQNPFFINLFQAMFYGKEALNLNVNIRRDN
jgi:hypothetical protein